MRLSAVRIGARFLAQMLFLTLTCSAPRGFAALAEEAKIQAAATEDLSDEFASIAYALPDGQFVSCDGVVGMTLEDCQNNQLLIAYVAGKFTAMISNGFVKEGWYTINPGREAFERFSGPEEVRRYPEIKQAQKAMADYTRNFVANEWRRLPACLRSDCGKVIAFSMHTQEEWAAIFEEGAKLELCLIDRDRNKDAPEIKTNAHYGTDGASAKYRAIIDGFIPNCRISSAAMQAYIKFAEKIAQMNY